MNEDRDTFEPLEFEGCIMRRATRVTESAVPIRMLDRMPHLREVIDQWTVLLLALKEAKKAHEMKPMVALYSAEKHAFLDSAGTAIDLAAEKYSDFLPIHQPETDPENCTCWRCKTRRRAETN